MDTWLIVLIVVAVVVVVGGAIAWWLSRRKRTERLQEQVRQELTVRHDIHSHASDISVLGR